MENSLDVSSRKIFIVCLCLFIFAACVRVLVWQNNKSEINRALSVISEGYKEDARRLLEGNLKEFLAGKNPPVDANILAHPPGYSILMTIVYGIFGENESMRIVQILLNSFAPVVIFFIALELFNFRVACIAGFLTALSPQISYNSVLMLPDALAVLPILLAVYFFILAYKKEKLQYAVLCAAFLGVSCWLRANALLLVVFFALFALILLPKKLRFRFALILVAVFVLIISPITIRNYVVFHRFIPVSLGTGLNLVAGIADYDKEGRFKQPAADTDRIKLEAETHNRADYNNSLYNPDGIERERERTKIALEIIRTNPLWFAGVAAQRALMIMRLERVPAIAADKDEGETTNAFFYYLNLPLKLFQRLFITAVFLPLLITGIIILIREKEQRKKLLILSVVPLYYISVHSLIHTEYRYVLALQHIVLILSAAALSFLISKVTKHVLRKSDT